MMIKDKDGQNVMKPDHPDFFSMKRSIFFLLARDSRTAAGMVNEGKEKGEL